MYDVIIVGGGPAGLSAALMLGRCRRRVLVCDAGNPRNRASRALHGYLTRDGIAPLEFLGLGRDELVSYGVEVRRACVSSASPMASGFEVVLESAARLQCRRLLIATGVVDRLPPLEGIETCYGRSVFHCPYCDGWEVRDQPLSVYGRGTAGYSLALSLKTWSDDVMLFTDGPARLTAGQRKLLEQHDISVYTGRVARLDCRDGQLSHVILASGKALARRALFFSTGQVNRSAIAAQLGCRFTRKGVVETGPLGESNIPGLYVAGDASFDVQWVVVAAAEGAKVALAINRALQTEARQAVDA